MRRLLSVGPEDLDLSALAEAVQILDAEAAADGAFLLPGPTVLLLEAMPDGSWRLKLLEPAD